MGNFSNNAITDKGRVLLADVQAGAVFTPTRIVIGSGYLPNTSTTRSITDVVTPVKSLSITKKNRTPDGKCIFGGVYTNEDIISAFYFRELALYAKAVYLNADGSVNSEGAEVLYSYGNAGDTGDLMPAYSTSAVIEKQIDLVVYVGNDTAVNLTVESGLGVSRQEFDSHASRHSSTGEDPIKPEDIGAIPLDGSIPMSGRSLWLYNNHALVGANDSRAVLNSYPVAGSADAYRSFVVRNENEAADMADAFCFAEKVAGGGELLYRVYGEHNPPPVSFGVINATDLIAWADVQETSGSFLVAPSITTEGVPNNSWFIGFLDCVAGGKRICMTDLTSHKHWINLTRENIFSGWVEQYNASNPPTSADIVPGVFSGLMQANAAATTDVTNPMIRNIKAGTTDLSAGSSPLATGSIYLVYE